MAGERAWPPDKVLALVQAGLLQGKSIGFLPTKVHVPDEKEAQAKRLERPGGLVIDEWLLLEYACVFLPANQNALVEAVSKGSVGLDAELLRALGLDAALLPSPLGGEGLGVKGKSRPVPFTPLAEVERAATRAVESVDWGAFVTRRVAERIDRLRGRV